MTGTLSVDTFPRNSQRLSSSEYVIWEHNGPRLDYPENLIRAIVFASSEVHMPGSRKFCQGGTMFFLFYFFF